ncbi:MAG: class I SAM-dependent methyltransferase, partial [Rhodanobacteraceae bacterium]
MIPGNNNVVVEAWNTILYDKFCRFRHLLVDGLSKHSDAALTRTAYAPGQRILDIGCGFGDSTLEIALSVAPDGEAVGIDCAERFIASSRKDAAEQNVDNARFVVADAQGDSLDRPYDHAFARFGTMFFDWPGAAMRNIRKALKPGGSLTQIVWRRREENPWLYEAEQCVRKIVPAVEHNQTDAVHCGPGPFSMAGPDMVSLMLRSAGFERITFERHDCDICVGSNLDEAIEFAIALGPAGEIMRLAGEQGEALKPEVIDALKIALQPFV